MLTTPKYQSTAMLLIEPRVNRVAESTSVLSNLPADFEMASIYGVPAGSSLADWPIGYADVAPYYDRANCVASLGMWNSFLEGFMATIDLRPRQRVLDVCAGTNAIGIALLKREPSLEVHVLDPEGHTLGDPQA